MTRQIRLDQIDDVMREAVEDLVKATTLEWTRRVKKATPVRVVYKGEPKGGGQLRNAWQTDIKKFQGKNGTRFLVGTPQTGGYGITLTQAHTVIYYSNGYDLEKRLQSEDRAHRIGQTKPVTYIDIIAEDTVDNKIVKALRKKVNIASEVMGEELKAWI